MARNDDGDGIVVVRLSDGAKAFRIADRARDLAHRNESRHREFAATRSSSASGSQFREDRAPVRSRAACRRSIPPVACERSACAFRILPTRRAGQRSFAAARDRIPARPALIPKLRSATARPAKTFASSREFPSVSLTRPRLSPMPHEDVAAVYALIQRSAFGRFVA